MKTRNILASSLLLVSILSLHTARAFQPPPQPDLIIRNVRSIEDYQVIAVVENIGKAASTVCVVTLDIIDPSHPAQTVKTLELSVPALDPGKYFIATFETSPQKAKGNRLQLWVDPTNRVRESNHYNNRTVDTSTVTKSSVATSGGFPKGSPPDLVIKGIAGTPSSKRALRVEVANVGTYEPSEPCTLTIQIFKNNDFDIKDVVETKDFNLPALKKGETKWVLVEVDREFEQSDNKNQVTPLMPFRLYVDSKKAVDEADETNNRKQYPVPTAPKTPYKP